MPCATLHLAVFEYIYIYISYLNKRKISVFEFPVFCQCFQMEDSCFGLLWFRLLGALLLLSICEYWCKKKFMYQ